MIQKSKCNRLILLSVFLPLSLLFLLPFNCQAGGLNASEQELVSKAMGTFEWNGKYYRAKQMYLDQLNAYLCQDDVDLSADACDAAAAEMYGNVERGVTEGYLYEISENRKTEEAPAKVMEEQGAEAEGSKTENTGNPEKIEVQEHSGLSEMTAGEETETDEALFSVYLGLNRRQLSRLCAGNHRNKTSTAFEDNTEWRFLNPLSYRILGGIEAVCILLLAAALAVTVKSRGLRYRSRFKKIVRRIAVCMISFACFLISALAALGFGAFSEQTVLNRAEKTSWYQTIYDEIMRETVVTLDFVLGQGDQSGAGLKYDNLVLAARQQMKAELKGTASGMDLSSFMAPVRASVAQYYGDRYPNCPVVADGVKNLMEDLEMRCEKLAHWAGTDWWREKSQKFFDFLPFGLGGVVLILLMGTAELVFLKRSGSRTIKRIGGGLAWGFALLVCVSLLLLGYEGTRKIQPEPAYMNEFIRYTTVSVVYSAWMIGGIGVCMAAMILYLEKCMKYER